MIDRGADRTTDHGAIMVFDGVCNLCSFMVRFVLRHDKQERRHER
jgi:predicted DCC family thiol-disulfide oxidoreductase YuxK